MRAVAHCALTLLVLALVAALIPLAAPAVAQTDQRCFPETGQCIAGPIRQYWERGGGLPVFGFPIAPQSAELVEGQPLQAQWFERDRLEIQADGRVTAGRLGVERLAQMGTPWQPGPGSPAGAGCAAFAETGYQVCGTFAAYWKKNGGLVRFGLPVTGEFTADLEGKPYTVQYFERRRFELHPEVAPTTVLLGLLGREVFTARQAQPQPATPDQRADEAVTIRADGTLLVDAQPFFPFGFALYPRYRTDEFTPETLAAIAAAGFNTLHAPIRDNYPDLLADAQRLNLHLLAEIYPYELDDAGIQAAISLVKGRPGLLAYAIADDVGDGGYYTPEIVARVNQLVKQVDRQHPTYISSYNPAQIAPFISTADIFAMQSYPIGQDTAELRRLSHVNYALSKAVAAGKTYQRPIIANLQAFAWPAQREPTATEIRNMTYQALLNNVRGIIYYAYNDSVWRIEQHPQVLHGVQSLAPEIKRLSPALLDGVYTPLQSGNQYVLAAQWVHNNSRYIIVVNTDERAADVAINLPKPARGQVAPLFAERPAGMVLKNGQLSGTLDALAVHVYVLN